MTTLASPKRRALACRSVVSLTMMLPPLSGRHLLSAILKNLRPIFSNSLPIDLMDVGKEKDMVAVVVGADMIRLMVLK